MHIGVDGADLNIRRQLVEVVTHANVFSVLVDGWHLHSYEAVGACGGHVEGTAGDVARMHDWNEAGVVDFEVVL